MSDTNALTLSISLWLLLISLLVWFAYLFPLFLKKRKIDKLNEKINKLKAEKIFYEKWLKEKEDK